MKDCIIEVVDQYAAARGNNDVEYAVCKMASGKHKTFEIDELEFEAFEDDREKYWANRGWHLVERGGRKTLTTTP